MSKILEGLNKIENTELRERRKREWKENQAVSVQQEGEGYEAF